jgi:hypothetical protein
MYDATLGRFLQRDLDVQSNAGTLGAAQGVASTAIDPGAPLPLAGVGLYLYVMDAPTVAVDPSGWIKWNTAKLENPRKVWAPWPGRPIWFVAYTVQTDAEKEIEVYKPVDNKSYWCHGFTFGGSSAAGGPYSIDGSYVTRVLVEDGWKSTRCCLATKEDIVVFVANNKISHSGKISAIVVTDGVLDENKSMIDSKWGPDPQNVSSFLKNTRKYGSYRCYSQAPKKIEKGCCKKGRGET